MPALEESRNHHGADVACATNDEDRAVGVARECGQPRVAAIRQAKKKPCAHGCRQGHQSPQHEQRGWHTDEPGHTARNDRRDGERCSFRHRGGELQSSVDSEADVAEEEQEWQEQGRPDG